MIIDAKVLTEPVAWKITKVHRLAPNGLVRLTYAQDRFDQHKDYIELDNTGNVIGMWADYYQSEILPEDHNIIENDSINVSNNPLNKITFNGLKPQVKISGSYKTLTAYFYDSRDFEVENYDNISWSFTVDNIDIGNQLEILTSTSQSDINNNQIKIRFIGSDDYIGKILLVTCNNIGISTELQLEIVGM